STADTVNYSLQLPASLLHTEKVSLTPKGGCLKDCKDQAAADPCMNGPRPTRFLRIESLLPIVNAATDSNALRPPRLESSKAQNIDLPQTLNLVMKQNLQIAFAQQNIPITKWNYIGALGGFLPNATLDLSEGGDRHFVGAKRLPVQTSNISTFAKFDMNL